MKIDEEKLTAYAFGELEGLEEEQVEKYVKESHEARKYVEEIRQTAGLITEELKTGPDLVLGDEQREKIRAASRLPGSATSGKQLFILLRWLIVPAAAVALLIFALDRFILSPSRSMKSNSIMYSRYPDEEFAGESLSKPYKEGIIFERKEFETYGYSGGIHSIDNLSNETGSSESARLIHGIQDVPTEFNTEQYDNIVENVFLRTTQNPLSTFSIDVDTASFSNTRRYINQGTLPPKDAVRIEELINYFSYEYPHPDGDQPFSVNVEIAACPWNLEHRLAKIGLKGREIDLETRPPANIVFLLDVSGSMNDPNKLPLVKTAMRMLVDSLEGKDLISIAVYAGASGLVLPATSCEYKEGIIASLDRLNAGGSTNGGAGIELAYRVATQNYIEEGINRVILCTDGDFNVGITDDGSLVSLIEKKAKSGVFLSILGFGMGNYKDSKMEKLADKGNGNYSYIDTELEAKKVLCDQIAGTLVTIAKDVKIQVEFNPDRVNAYRLIGYENRMLRKEDFNDDTKDAGEIGAGHTVTALYELVPFGKEIESPGVYPLRYRKPDKEAESSREPSSNECFFLKLRYKEPDGDTSRLITLPVVDTGMQYTAASGDFKFAASVASFGMILRDSKYKGSTSLDAVLELAEEGVGVDKAGYREAFIQLVKQTRRIMVQR